MRYKKIIIWGHPLHSHTHSYVHEAYFKAFQYLGYEVYWFHDNDYPTDFDWTNCLFIGEGFADKHLPVNDSSCYAIMYCPDPSKYYGGKQYIDIRLSGVGVKDHIYDFSLDKNKAIKLGPCCYLEPSKNIEILLQNRYHKKIIQDYNKLYIAWATNLLPCEINMDTMYASRENKIYFCGTLSDSGQCENMSNFLPFLKACKENNIEFAVNDPWIRPISSDDVIYYTRRSLLGIDIRGPEHLKTETITCRVFKNISYGHLGLTNSIAIQEALDGNCIYNPDTYQLFYDGLQYRKNYDLIRRGMLYVKEKHTYLNRIDSLLKAISVCE